MSTLAIETRMASAQNVNLTDDALIVDLNDGRTVYIPLAWFPRLLHGTPEERNKWRLIGDGEGIHWPDLIEDISVENLILGKSSGATISWLSLARLDYYLEGQGACFIYSVLLDKSLFGLIQE